METCKGPVCDLGVLVPLVSTAEMLHALLKLTMASLCSDIAYYGINLNQSVILEQIGYADGPTPWVTLRNTAIGNIIVQAAVRSELHSP